MSRGAGVDRRKRPCIFRGERAMTKKPVTMRRVTLPSEHGAGHGRMNAFKCMSKIPDDITAALESAGLSDAHRREYLKWIGEAKRPETRKARIGQAMRMLSKKRAEEVARAKKAG
jgi:hypothetical protein